MDISANNQAGDAASAIPVICDKCKAEGSAGEGGFAGIASIAGMLEFEPVPRRPQVGNWTPDQQRAFIVALAVTGSPKRAGIAIGRDDRGAMKLRTARGGEGFAKAWEAALAIHREQQAAAERERMASRPGAASGQNGWAIYAAGAAGGRREARFNEPDPDALARDHAESKERIRDRMLRARRLYLLAICGDEAKRAAWETLVGPVDWDKAVALQPQDNEPYPPRMMEPDMLLTAEGGCLPDVAPTGRDRGEEFMEAMDEVRETGEVDGPKMVRFGA